MDVINLSELSLMLKTAATRVIYNKRKIDKINVFPVADQDTGSNLTKTLASFKQALGQNAVSTDSLLTKALEAGLASSQGNSGLLIISYLGGLLESLKNKSEIGYFDFSNAFHSATSAAVKSVENPLEGTMLDVMEAFSQSFSADVPGNKQLNRPFERALAATKESLVKTESKMKILLDNNIVDAGALGFTLFIFGFSEKITKVTLDLSTLDVSPVKILPDLKNLENPYEVIFILENPTLTQDELRDILHPYGDSLDIVELENKAKIHIHTDNPEAVEATAQVLGEVGSIETFDMRIKNPNHV